LNEKILGRQARHDRRLESALLMLERFDVIQFSKPIAGTEKKILHYSTLPDSLTNETELAEKLRRDQQKLLAMVEYVRCETDRRDFLTTYFLGTPADA
jgi:ATP-dependent DNA helicase RecQ